MHFIKWGSDRQADVPKVVKDDGEMVGRQVNRRTNCSLVGSKFMDAWSELRAVFFTTTTKIFLGISFGGDMEEISQRRPTFGHGNFRIEAF